MNLLKPKAQAPAPQAPAPAVETPPPTRVDPMVVQSEQRDAIRRKRGRAATLLTGTSGDTSVPMTSATTRVLGG